MPKQAGWGDATPGEKSQCKGRSRGLASLRRDSDEQRSDDYSEQRVEAQLWTGRMVGEMGGNLFQGGGGGAVEVGGDMSKGVRARCG